MYEPIKLANGNIDWDAENRRRRATPQPTVNQATARQPEPVKANVETVDDRIKYAQSWNLAVAIMAGALSNASITLSRSDSGEQLKIEIESWQKYFHNKLINK